MARPNLPKAVNKGAKDKPFSRVGENVTQSEWDRIFGKKTAKQRAAEKGKTFILVDGKLVEQCEDTAARPSAPAIHDDSLYTKMWDYGAGRKWNSRTERREWMKRKGVIEAG